MRFQHAADAPGGHGVALRLYFGAQPAGTIALAVISRRFAHGYLPGRFYHRHLLAALPGVVRGVAQELEQKTPLSRFQH